MGRPGALGVLGVCVCNMSVYMNARIAAIAKAAALACLQATGLKGVAYFVESSVAL